MSCFIWSLNTGLTVIVSGVSTHPVSSVDQEEVAESDHLTQVRFYGVITFHLLPTLSTSHFDYFPLCLLTTLSSFPLCLIPTLSNSHFVYFRFVYFPLCLLPTLSISHFVFFPTLSNSHFVYFHFVYFHFVYFPLCLLPTLS